MNETAIENYLRDEVKKFGGIAYKFTSPSRRSVPDRLVLVPGGQVCFVELKATGKKPSEAQLREHKRLEDMGHPTFVIDSKGGVDEFIDMLKRRRW